MELLAILVLPALASALSLSPLGRRFAAPITLASAVIVFALAGRCGPQDRPHRPHQ